MPCEWKFCGDALSFKDTMKPNIERKSLGITEFKMLDDGNGGMECVPSRFGQLDSYGDIVLAGAYAKTLEFFNQRGFVAHSHDWTYNGVIGYPETAFEDADGLRVRMAFHGDEGSQAVRQKAKERMDAGKDVLLSIGFVVENCETVLKSDYDVKIPGIIGGAKWAEIRDAAQQFAKIRLVKQIKLYEFSLVTVPALDSAAAVSVRSGEPEQRSKYLGRFAEGEAGIEAIYSLFSSLCYGPIYKTLFDEESTPDYDALQAACDEFGALVVTICQTMRAAMDASADPGEPAGDGESAGDGEDMQAAEIRKLGLLVPSPQDISTGLRGGNLIHKISAAVSAAESKAAFRASEGRVLSSQQRESLAALQARIFDVLSACENRDVDPATEQADESVEFEKRKNEALAEHYMLSTMP